MPARALNLHQDVLREPRLMAAVTHPFAAWFFSTTGEAILWANPAGVPFAATYQRAAEAGSQVRQVAGRLPAGQPRLERLRGFGGPMGRLLTCMCTRLTLANGISGLLVMALDPLGTQMPLEERLRQAIAGNEAAHDTAADKGLAGATLAAFDSSGTWLAGAAHRTGLFQTGASLCALGLDGLRQEALQQGYATALTPSHRVHLFRAGEANTAGLIAEAIPLFPGAVPMPAPAEPATPASAPAPIAQERAEAEQTKPHYTEPQSVKTDTAPEHLEKLEIAQPDSSPPQSVTPDSDSLPLSHDAATSDDDQFPSIDSRLLLGMPEHAFSPPYLPREFRGPAAEPEAAQQEVTEQETAQQETAQQETPQPEANTDHAAFADIRANASAHPHPTDPHSAQMSPPRDIGVSDFPAIEDAPLVAPEIHAPEPEAQQETKPATEPDPAPPPAPDAKAGQPEPPPVEASSDIISALSLETPLPTDRRYPLRFMWQMSADGRFMLGSDEFLRLIGMQTATALGRTWSDINNALSLDPHDHVARALATRETWSGILVRWPLDGSGERLAVELSGLPLFDHNRHYLGYRGFGVCRDLDGLARIAHLRSDQGTASSTTRRDEPATTSQSPAGAGAALQAAPANNPLPTSNVTHLPMAMPYPPAPNVVPFRILGETKGPILTPGDNSAFNELARQLTERLNANDDKADTQRIASSDALAETTIAEAGDTPAPVSAPAMPEPVSARIDDTATPKAPAPGSAPHEHDVIAVATPHEQETMRDQEPRAPFGQAPIERPLLDRLPVGVLIYRLDRLLYANRIFLEHTGFASLDALTEAGGLDALFVTPAHSHGGLDISDGDDGTPLTIATASGERVPMAARLFTVPWGTESAMALVFARHGLSGAPPAHAEASPTPAAPPPALPDDNAAKEFAMFRAVLDGVNDAVFILDRDARIVTLNRAASALFDDPRRELEGRPLADVIAPESQTIALGYFDNLDRPDVTNLMNHPRDTNGRDNPGRDIRARSRDNRILPLALTMARAGDSGERFYAIFRDASRPRPAADSQTGSQANLQAAMRAGERAASEKAGLLARISQEIRAPLNAIIGFADVMIGEKFGPLGNERYTDYLKDIRQSGEHVVTLIDNLVNLTHIQSGKVAFTFANINLNELIEQCVAIMQPQANRDRIIIRTSLAHSLPPVYADARALRQIALNLVTHSIRLAQAGGQVIVSTALSDHGDVTLRVRNTGAGMSEAQIEAALEPFAAAGQPGTTPNLDLSLSKALSEANRARFAITSNGQQQGTLIEVIFARTEARAG